MKVIVKAVFAIYGLIVFLLWFLWVVEGYDFIVNYTFSSNYKELIHFFDLGLSAIGICVLYLYVFDVKIITGQFWLFFGCFMIIWNVCYNFFLMPVYFNWSLDWYHLLSFVFYTPLFVSFILYSKIFNSK